MHNISPETRAAVDCGRLAFKRDMDYFGVPDKHQNAANLGIPKCHTCDILGVTCC